MISKELFSLAITLLVLVSLSKLSSVQGCSASSPETPHSPEIKTSLETTTSTETTPYPEPPIVEDCPEYSCNDNKKCYTKAQQCDGKNDCDDGTDEDAGHCGKQLLQMIRFPKNRKKF